MTALKSKPILIFDGDCNFCRRWVARWRYVTKDRVDFEPSQKVADLFPQIPPENYPGSVQLVDVDGAVYQGSEAVFRTLAHAPGKRWLANVYYKVPGFAPISERVYRLVAENREVFSKLTHWLWGDHLDRPSYILTRRVFLILFGFIYFTAFVSLWSQIEGLVGSRGILPAADFLSAVTQQTGVERYWLVPTLAWLDSSNGFLNFLCLAGMGGSLCIAAGIFPAGSLFLCWVIYLSLLSIGREFLAFQWDTLLLETGFLAIFFAPWRFRPKLATETEPSPMLLGLLRFLLFRVIFSSGMVKLASGDESWRSLTALNFHYETQPLPTWVGWYAHQLPSWFQKFSVGGVFFVQLVVPFFIFAPRRIRLWACAVLAGFQIMILLTGNYCFFNLLTLALCLLLVDDAFLKPFFPQAIFERVKESWIKERETRLKRLAIGVLACIIIFVSVTVHLAPLVLRTRDFPESALAVYRWIQPFHSINGYGLFAVMTTSRPEIILQGSNDGEIWKTYEFKWKPGDLKRAPAFVTPHQPRLDWQMWFAALGNYQQNPWLINFMVRVLQGSEKVVDLLGSNPFAGKPPKFIRAEVYDYRFTDFSEWGKNGSWWKRERVGAYAPVLRLPESP